jgi:hypothetical protein
MPGQHAYRVQAHPQTGEQLLETGERASHAALADFPTTDGRRAAPGGTDQFLLAWSDARTSQSSQSTLQRLSDAGFTATPILTPLSLEVLSRLSEEEVDLLVSVKEPLSAAQDGILSLTVGDTRDRGPWTASQRLRGKMELILPLIFAPNRALFSHPQLARQYPVWALTIYFLARNFLPLMETALARAQMLAETDPVAAGTAAYLVQHIEEERHGAEGYGEAHLADLRALGVDPAQARQLPLPPTIATLVGYHYDWIIQRHPVAIFGFLEVAEGYPPSVAEIEDLIARSGLPRAAFDLLFEHADLDVNHRDELHEMLDRLPLTPEQEGMLGLSAMRTVELMSQSFWSALDSHVWIVGGVGE